MRRRVIFAVVAAVVAAIQPTAGHAVTTTSVPIPTAGSFPIGITSGVDGNIWFTEIGNSSIGKVTTDAAHTLTDYHTPSSSSPLEIASGHDGNMWFTENDTNIIGKSSTTGSIVEFAVPTANSGPAGITPGPDGNMWFTESKGDKIGKITSGGLITEYAFPPLAATICRAPHTIVTGPDGNLWFTESSNENCQAGPQSNTCFAPDFTSPCLTAYQHIGRITPAGVVTEFALPTSDALPFVITVGPDNNLWFTEFTGNRVGRILTASPNTVTEFTLPSTPIAGCLGFPAPAGCAFPKGISAGQDGNLWFTESRTKKVGRITPGAPNSITETTLTSGPQYITAGSDGNLWYAEGAGNSIGRLVPDAVDHNLAGVVGGDNALYAKLDAAPFQPLNGGLLAAPAVVSVPDNTGATQPLYIGLGGDHRLYVRNTGTSWQRLVTPDHACFDNPAATVTGTGPYTLTVVCQGGDRALYFWQTPVVAGSLPTISTAFQALGGTVLAGPAVAPINGVLTFFAEGTDHVIYYRTTATGYTALPAACIGHPAVASNGPVAYAACQGLDGRLYYSVKFGAAPWGAFRSAGDQQLIDGPGISVTPTRATFYAEAVSQHLIHVAIHLNDGTLATPVVDDGGLIKYGAGATSINVAPPAINRPGTVAGSH